MIKKNASPEAYEILWGRFQDIQTQVVQEYLSGNHPCQPWNLIPSSKLKRIWSSFTATGFVRDEKGLMDIQDMMVENLCRIEVSNIVSGHTSHPMESVLMDYFEDDTELVTEHQDKFCDWAIDLPEGGWRISDYGTPKMFPLMALAIGAQTAKERLVYLDMALNVIHQRSDLASWFIEGGSQTLREISGEGLSH